MMVFMGDKVVGAEFRKSEKWENVFKGGATTGGRMDKRRPQLDSAHRIGLRSLLKNLLTVVLMGFMGDKVVGAKFRKSERGGMFSMAEPQRVVVWRNGGHGWIQHVK